MRPFVQHVSNNLTSAPQQVVGGTTSNMVPNLMQIQSQMGFLPNNNPGFNSNFVNNSANTNIPFNNSMNIPNFNALQNSHMMGGSGQQIQSTSGFPPQNFGQNMNVLGFPVNGQLGNLGQGNPNQLFGNNTNNNINGGQFGWQNQLPNMSQLGNMPFLNPSQVNALTQLLGCANRVAQAMNPQNTAFFGNPQLGFGLGGLQQTNYSQQLPVASQQMAAASQHLPVASQQLAAASQHLPVASQQMAAAPQHLPVASQQLPNVSVPPLNPVVSAHLHGQPSNYLHNHGKKQGVQTSNSSHHQAKNFVNPKRDASNSRFQNSRGHHLHNSKGKHNVSSINEGKGTKDAGHDNSASPSKSGKKRSLAMLYTEKEIQQWREERKKNYPSKCNVEKKLTQKQADTDAAEEAAKLRRQQLKDVLAKQVELGFEVPEIPSHYLLDPDHQSQGRDKYRRPLNKGRFSNNGRFQNKFNRGDKFNRKDRFVKRGTEDDGSFRKHEQFPKRQKVEDDDSSKTPLSVKEPTLLQKLLSSDMKKDNSRLLQAFRFMVINCFFKDFPDKPLNFPKVIVKETGVDSEACVFKELSNSENEDVSVEKDSENVILQEEGEITD